MVTESTSVSTLVATGNDHEVTLALCPFLILKNFYESLQVLYYPPHPMDLHRVHLAHLT